MKNIINMFIYLLIYNIYIVSIHSYGQSKFLNNDNDLNEILHDNLIEVLNKRSERVLGVDSTLAYDGSGPMTSENI